MVSMQVPLLIHYVLFLLWHITRYLLTTTVLAVLLLSQYYMPLQYYGTMTMVICGFLTPAWHGAALAVGDKERKSI